KTTQGACLADELGCDFLDTDDLLGTPRALYEKLGEEKFREKEKEAILSLRFDEPTVIALGGGAILDQEIENFCRSLGEIIYLDVPYETILTRTILPARFTKKLYDERKKKYEAIANGV
ncbi:MAG: shikimate kinase, partial [Simkaniaceae bacterium]|nr:shikimate kinase [Simkaniaceae bacterium]